MARPVPEINAGSTADIAFLLLIFFLVTTTMDTDSGIVRKLPPPVENNDEQADVKERNVLKILVNSHDMLLIDGKPGNINYLKDKTIDFMSIHLNNDDYPEVKEVEVEELGGRKIWVSKGIVSLKNDRGTSYDMYIQVQNELARAFNEMKDEMSVNIYNTKYNQLIKKDEIKVINKLVPVRVSEAEPEDIGGGN